ncbi:MAG: hypothetical protein AAFQ92_24075 [Bacteroidota bacterium]
MKSHNIFLFYLLLLSLSSCAQESRYVTVFADTKAYELARSVEKGDLRTMEILVKQDSELMNLPNPITGSNVLALAVQVEQTKAFQKLLELGANPNFINPYTKHSILMDAIKPFGSQFEWRKEPQYVELLLKHGADPNYTIESDFTNEKQIYIGASSPLIKASRLDLDLVKLLVKNGADPHKRLRERKIIPLAEALKASKYDIIYYYIDTLNIDIHQPMSTVLRQPDNEKVTYYIQDYAVNKFTKAKILGQDTEVEKLKQRNGAIEQANQKRWELIKDLESRGVDFKNYDYKL